YVIPPKKICKKKYVRVGSSYPSTPPPPLSPSPGVISGFLSQDIEHSNASYSCASPPVTAISVTVAGPSSTSPPERSCLNQILRSSPVSNSKSAINLIASSSSS